MNDINDIIATVNAALAHRDQRRDALAARIRATVESALLRSARERLDLGLAGALVVAQPSAQVAQYERGPSFPRRGDRQWVLLALDGTAHSLGVLKRMRYYDGSNMHHQVGPWRCYGQQLRPATVAQLRAVASALPAALARALASVQAEARAADASKLPQGDC